jgi:hypothetical protein
MFAFYCVLSSLLPFNHIIILYYPLLLSRNTFLHIPSVYNVALPSTSTISTIVAAFTCLIMSLSRRNSANLVISSDYGSMGTGKLPTSSSSFRLKHNPDGTLTILEPPAALKYLSWVSCAAFLVSFVLYLVSCVVSNYANSGTGFELGSFRACDTVMNVCSYVKTNCYSTFQGQEFLLLTQNCSEYNAFRVFLVLGLCASFFAYLSIIGSLFANINYEVRCRHAALFLGYFSAVTGLIAMILFMHFKDTVLGNATIAGSSGVAFGSAFITGALAWSSALFTSILYSILYCIERNSWLTENQGLLQGYQL